MRVKVVVFAGVCWLCATLALGQNSAVNQGISNITGTGARALGMGGAFVALADDATAASWNPAGLAQLTRPGVSLVYDWSRGPYDTKAHRVADYINYPVGHTITTDTAYHGTLEGSFVGFAGVTYPFVVKSRLFVAQASYRRMASFPTLAGHSKSTSVGQWADGRPDTTGGSYVDDKDAFTGGFDSYSLSLATQLGSKVRVGVSLNYVTVDVTDRYAQYFHDLSDPVLSEQDYWLNAEYSFSGGQADLGVQWAPISQLTFGAVYHTGFTAKTKQTASQLYNWNADYYGEPPWPLTSSAFETNVHWPDAYQIGVAWQPVERLILAADYGAMAWSKAKLDEYQFPEWDENLQPTIVTYNDLPFPSYGAKQNDSSSVRVGAEYILLFGKHTAVPLRAGYFRERQLAPLSGFAEGGRIPSPPPTYTGFTLGAGLTYGKVQFDVAWVRTDGTQEGSGTWDTTSTGGTRTIHYNLTRKITFTQDRILASLIVGF
ncbi:MAG: hypothetical protein LAO05_11760 [Acidobacteriia bacterium]|nr:hypothetical protein [Terriglobia bacterium]